MNKTTPSRKKLLLMEQFISLIIIFKTHLNQLNVYIYYAVLLGFFIGKYFKEGNTVGSIGQYLAALFLLISSLTGIFVLTHVGIVLAIINYMFVSPTLYTLPDFSPKVGLRQNFSKMKNNKQLYWTDWYPIAQDLNNESYQMKWAHTVQRQKMATYKGVKNKFVLKLFKFFTSSTLTYKLTFAKGTPGKCKGDIFFSHGRGGTPFIYSSILKSFGRDWRILAPQHSQVNVTPYTQLKDIKRFRQIQVKQRAQQIVYLTNRIGETDPIVLMAHSYGCATILQAYNLMPLSVRKRVTHIVLLDPWLFPLPEDVFNDQIICPVLMLANQHFLQNQDMYERNKQFIKRHHSKLTYICWKGGDHLHQTDMAFVVGSSLRQIKNSKESWPMMERNIQAIQMFLDFTKVGIEEQQRFRYRFSVYDLGEDFKPQKWIKSINF